MAVRMYSELIAWQKAMDLVEAVYHVTREFPRAELYGLTNQLRRAVISIPSNIAEGQGHHSTPDFLRFLGMAQGSLLEVETQILIAERLRYIPAQQRETVFVLRSEVGRLLMGLTQSLKRRDHKPLATSH